MHAEGQQTLERHIVYKNSTSESQNALLSVFKLDVALVVVIYHFNQRYFLT